MKDVEQQQSDERCLAWITKGILESKNEVLLLLNCMVRFEVNNRGLRKSLKHLPNETFFSQYRLKGKHQQYYPESISTCLNMTILL